MNTSEAIQVLAAHYGAEYLGTHTVPACSGNLIEDIMWEGEAGKVFHQFATEPKTLVGEDSLIGLAKHYSS